MNNIEIIREKADAVISAVEKIQNLLGLDDDKAAAVETVVDERYSLIAVRGGQAWFVMEGDEVILDFIPDDDFNEGDIIGGFISLYLEN